MKRPVIDRRAVLGVVLAVVVTGCIDRSADASGDPPDDCEQPSYLVVDRQDATPEEEEAVLSHDDERVADVEPIQRGLQTASETDDEVTTVDLSPEDCADVRDGVTDGSGPLYVRLEGEVYQLRVEGDDESR